MIRAENLIKNYGEYRALRDVSLVINKSEIVSIVGASGAGKTTLLQILGTLAKPDSGKVLIQGTEVSALSDKNLARFRNENIGFVFQFHHLLPEFTSFENVCLPGYLGRRSRKEVEARARDLLVFLGLSERMDHKPQELSGGEKQRVAIARALINNPAVVLADEPSGNLDSANTQELYSLILSLRERFGQTFVIVTHNTELANVSDRIFIMRDGQIVEEVKSLSI